MSLGIRVNAALKKPLYQQLVEAIAELIADGAFHDGERLPSVRDLALEVRINPNTVARAYQELENKALVSSHQGKGVFVRLPASGEIRNLPPELAQALDQVIETARDSGFPLEQLDIELRRRAIASSQKEK